MIIIKTYKVNKFFNKFPEISGKMHKFPENFQNHNSIAIPHGRLHKGEMVRDAPRRKLGEGIL